MIKHLLIVVLLCLAGNKVSAQDPTETVPEESTQDIVPVTPPVTPPAATIPESSEDPAPIPITGATLQGLDKITTRTTTIAAPLNQTVQFGTLTLIVRTCYEAPPEDKPESVAFMEVYESNSDKALFSGWMYTSTPGYSALEHPVYDVWVTGCTHADAPAESSTKAVTP